MNEMLDAGKAARYLNVSKWLVYELAKQKILPHIRIGKRLFFRKATLDDWLQSQEYASTNNVAIDRTIRKIQG